MIARLAALAVALTLLTPQAPQSGARDQTPPQLRGSWSATAGARVFAGSWTAMLDPARPDEAHGTWGLLDGRQIVAEGTWAATRTAAGWRGRWSAQVGLAGRGDASRPDYSGTWQATIADTSLTTLADMLTRTLQEDVTGTWRAGARSGAWRLGSGRR
jgi:hypothetical protein